MTLVDINRLLEDVQTLNDMPPRLQKLEDAKVLSAVPARRCVVYRCVSQPSITKCKLCQCGLRPPLIALNADSEWLSRTGVLRSTY